MDIRNIIFDLGNVLLNIDLNLTKEAFGNLVVQAGKATASTALIQQHVEKLERGTITEAQFREGMREFIGNEFTDADIDRTWNALLLDFPAAVIHRVEKVKQHYNIFLLSNTNTIHYKIYNEAFRNEFPYPSLDDFFSDVCYSCQTGWKKPEAEIYRYALDKFRIHPEQSLFIDDLAQNADAARRCSIHAIEVKGPADILDIFDENGRISPSFLNLLMIR